VNAPADDAPRTWRNQLTWLAAVLVGLEAAGVLGLAAFLIVELVRSTPDSLPAALGLIAMTTALSAGLAACTAGVLGHRGWVRGPVVTWQLIQGGVAMRLTSAVAWWLGLPLLVIAVIIGVLIAGPWILEPRDRTPG
jgi:hypothetical protein